MTHPSIAVAEEEYSQMQRESMREMCVWRRMKAYRESERERETV